MIANNAPPSSARRDPLRPSARRLVHLFLGAAAVLAAFAAGIVIGFTPYFFRLWLRERLFARAHVQDPTIDSASDEWLLTVWDFGELPGTDVLDYAATVVYTLALLIPCVLITLHILITRLVAGHTPESHGSRGSVCLGVPLATPP